MLVIQHTDKTFVLEFDLEGLQAIRALCVPNTTTEAQVIQRAFELGLSALYDAMKGGDDADDLEGKNERDRGSGPVVSD